MKPFATERPITRKELQSAVMTKHESLLSSTAGNNHIYANIMRKQPLMDENRIWLMTHILYDYLVDNHPGETPTADRWIIKPNVENIVPVITAAINLATKMTWNNKYPSSSCLIRHIRIFELARALDDILLDSTGDISLSPTEKQAAIEAAHAEMSYADDWLERKIGWRPFAKFHTTDQTLINTATTHVPEFAKLLAKERATKDSSIDSLSYKISDMRKATFENQIN